MKHWPPVNMEKRKARSPDRGSLLLQEPLSMNERAILFLMEVLNGFEEPPRSDWPRHEAEEVSFSRWAVEELLQQVWDHPWTLASETVERFAAKLGLARRGWWLRRLWRSEPHPRPSSALRRQKRSKRRKMAEI